MLRSRWYLCHSSPELKKQLSFLKTTYEKLREASTLLENKRCALSFGTTSRMSDILSSVKQRMNEAPEILRLQEQLVVKKKELRAIENKVAYKIIEKNQLLDQAT